MHFYLLYEDDIYVDLYYYYYCTHVGGTWPVIELTESPSTWFNSTEPSSTLTNRNILVFLVPRVPAKWKGAWWTDCGCHQVFCFGEINGNKKEIFSTGPGRATGRGTVLGHHQPGLGQLYLPLPVLPQGLWCICVLNIGAKKCDMKFASIWKPSPPLQAH